MGDKRSAVTKLIRFVRIMMVIICKLDLYKRYIQIGDVDIIIPYTRLTNHLLQHVVHVLLIFRVEATCQIPIGSSDLQPRCHIRLTDLICKQTKSGHCHVIF